MSTSDRLTWAQAIEALRDRERFVEWAFKAKPAGPLISDVAADYLTDRAAALTEEGGQ